MPWMSWRCSNSMRGSPDTGRSSAGTATWRRPSTWPSCGDDRDDRHGVHALVRERDAQADPDVGAGRRHPDSLLRGDPGHPGHLRLAPLLRDHQPGLRPHVAYLDRREDLPPPHGARASPRTRGDRGEGGARGGSRAGIDHPADGGEMNPLRSFLFAVLLAGAGAGLAATADAGPTVADCLDCHGDATIEKSLPDGKTLSLFVDEKEFRQSVHGKGTCTSCHTDAKAPHGKLVAVTCGKCHPDAEKSYSQSTHGLVHAKGVQDVPGCDDCHGRHDIRKAQDPKARTFRLNVVEACLRCHEDKVIEEKYGLPDQKVMAAYRESVHGRAQKKSGLLGAAVCPDCH